MKIALRSHRHALAWLLLTTGLALGGETPLPSGEENWQRRGNSAADVPAEVGGVFDNHGDTLSIGSWLTGPVSARFEYKQKLPLVEGMVSGKFRTTGLLPRQARVRVRFHQGDTQLATRDFALPIAEEWTEFTVPITRPPTGADSVRLDFGLAEKTAGRVEFANLRVSDRTEAPRFADGPPTLTRPPAPPPFAPGNKVRIAEGNGAWWLVSPAGRPFFSVGSAGANALRGQGLDSVAKQVRLLGFNSIGGSHDFKGWAEWNEEQLAAGKPLLYQFRIIETRVGTAYDTLLDATGANPGTPQAQAASRGGFNHAFPDPFDPRWQASVQEHIRSTLELMRDKPYFAGWFADNEREHRDLHRYVWSKYCTIEFRRFLEQRHASIAALNAAWGTRFGSFDELIAQKPDPVVRRGQMYEDFRAFSREILRKFNRTLLDSIRAADPGRLVLTNRFMIGEIADVLENLDLYRDFDAIAVNIYPNNSAAGLDASEKQLLAEFHRRTGKPILIGEWSVPALDSGLYNNPKRLDWSYPQTVATQQHRAKQAAQIEADLYNMPFVIGAHWFIWRDIDNANRQANRGLFRADGTTPWAELALALSNLNKRFAQP